MYNSVIKPHSPCLKAGLSEEKRPDFLETHFTVPIDKILSVKNAQA